jgi:hypothetical protein
MFVNKKFRLINYPAIALFLLWLQIRVVTKVFCRRTFAQVIFRDICLPNLLNFAKAKFEFLKEISPLS